MAFCWIVNRQMLRRRKEIEKLSLIQGYTEKKNVFHLLLPLESDNSILRNC